MSLLETIGHALFLLFSGDPQLWEIIGVSLKTAFFGMLIASPIALLLGYLIGTRSFFGRRFVIWITQAALSMPTVLIGLLLYLVLSRQGALGELGWLFTQSGIIAGQVLIALPLLIALTMSSVQSADPRLAETAIAHGASGWFLMRTILHEVRFGIMVALINGFGRVIAEVGCALMVGGNIAGDTRTITTAIALETSKGEFSQGVALGIVLIIIALAINAGLLVLQGDANTSIGIR